MMLSNFTQGRNNNFNLIRIVAALAVLIGHSFPLTKGSGAAEPFGEMLGMSMGTIAVDLFFIISGFLVTASLLIRQNAIEFIWSRVLRIFPALLIMLFLTVFALGVFFTTFPLSSYFTDSKTYIYLVGCTTLIAGAAYNLPGVFDDNPYKYVVNGSLWTLTYEIRMYAILAFLWIALRITNSIRLRTFKMIIIAGAVLAGVLVNVSHFYISTEGHFERLFFMFFSGAAFYVLKERIRLSHMYFWLFVITLLSSAIANTHAFFLVYTLTIAYVLFYIAYIPSWPIRKYNSVGDYSYGVYIYAFPIQQSVAALVPGISVVSMALISASLTFLLAALSWHLIERHALGLKGFFFGHSTRILSGLTGRSDRTC